MRIAALALAGSLAWSCGSNQPAVAPSPSLTRPSPSPAAAAHVADAPAPVAPTRPTFTNVPATPVGDQLAWVLDLIVRRHGKVEAAELEAHFHESFIKAVPIAQQFKVLDELARQLAKVAIDKTEGGDERLVAHASVGDAKLRIIVALDHATGKIAGLLFQPDTDAMVKPSSYDEAQHTLASLAPHASMLVASLDRGTCKPLHAVAASTQLAIGSTFKLYVLLGVADRLLAGKQHWEDELAVRDEWKSLPSGITQDDPAGTKLTIKTFAERMISISDNTATDHLLYTVGRKQVEAALREAKHAKPMLDVPFLGTRELFLLKLDPSVDAKQFTRASEAERRVYLDTTLAAKRPALAGAEAWTTARDIAKLEWFASGEDLCRVMATLWTRAQDPKAAAVLDVLAKNPGLPIDAVKFPYIGFKGGSEPGVLNLTYLLRRADGKWFVVTFGLNSDEGGTVSEDKLAGVALGVIDLVAAEK
jgi:beta-lactamase class A